MKHLRLSLLLCFLFTVGSTATAGTDAEYQQALALAQTRNPDLFDPAGTGWYWMTEYARAVRIWAAEGRPESVALLARPDRGLSQVIEWSRGRMAESASITDTTPPVRPTQKKPAKVTTTTIIGIGAGAAITSGGAFIIETVPGVWEIHHKDGTVERILKP